MSASLAGASQDRAAYLTSLSSHRSLPKISFGVRTAAASFVQPNANPGPGSYDIHKVDPDRQSKMKQQPTYNFGHVSCRKGMADTRVGPGPGAYGVPVDKGKYPTDRRSGFGGAPRRAIVRCPQVTAGPGMYTVKSTLGDCPTFTATGKRYRRHVKSLLHPGPGSYDPSHTANSKVPMAPQVGFGTMSREDNYAKHLNVGPGPGAYETPSLLGKDARQSAMTSRRRGHDLQPFVQPGPGEYYSHGSSFGY